MRIGVCEVYEEGRGGREEHSETVDVKPKRGEKRKKAVKARSRKLLYYIHYFFIQEKHWQNQSHIGTHGIASIKRLDF